MTRRGGRQGLPIRMGVTKKVLGSSHAHLELINKMMANIRHYYVRTECIGHIAVLAVDDLEKMPLDQLAYNGKKVHTVRQPTLAPTSNYSNGRKLVFTSMLVLSLNTVANQERAENKRQKLVRYPKDLSSLPLSAVQDIATLEDGTRKKIEITCTDRSGIPVVIIKAWSKNSKSEHEPWSQPASALQLDEDLLLLYQQLDQENDRTTKLHQHLFSAVDNRMSVPWLILTSDGASDQSVQNLMTIIPLVELMQMLDLDGLEKWNYCPGHSKYNPAERLNSTVKGEFRGGVLKSGNGQKQAMEEVKNKAAEHLVHTTHAGEPVRAIPHPCVGRNSERDRHKWEVSIEYDDLKKFSEYRSKLGPWFVTPVPEATLEGWRCSEHLDELMFAEMEDRLQWAIDHMEHYNIYGVILRKCAKNDLERCAWCKDHPWRGKDCFTERTTAANAVCPIGNRCAERVCDHQLNKTYMDLLLKMEAITPASGRAPRLCGICRGEGHNKKTCPHREGQDNPRMQGRGGERRR